MELSSNESSAPIAIEKIKILGEMVNGLDWQGYLAGSSKTAPRILKFTIAIGADYSSELIFMPTWVRAFCAHNNSCLDRVWSLDINKQNLI